MDIILTLVLVISVVGVGWVVAKVFRGGAPTGESSVRADINAIAAGQETAQMESVRRKNNE